MIRAYQYLFYRLYQWQLVLGEGRNAPLIGCAAISSFLFFNYLNVILYLNLFTGYECDFLYPYLKTRAHILFLYFVMIIINYFYLVRGGRNKKIIDQFRLENRPQRKKRTVLLWLYIIGTYFLFFLAIFLLMLRNRGELPFFPLRKY